MKIVTIWDIHWSNIWKDIVKNNPDADRFIFLWDYVDSFEFDDTTILYNLREIIDFKKEKPERVELLLWNHDIQYIWEWNNCSWRRESIAGILKIIFESELELFKIIHEERVDLETYIFSHAWISWQWLASNEDIIYKYFPDEVFENEELNKILKTSDRDIFFSVSKDNWGFAEASGPLWVRPAELEKDSLEFITQVVWHTNVPSITKKWNVVYCDTLNYWNWQPFIINSKEWAYQSDT